MKLVVDASVALKWFFRDRADETDVPEALDILRGYVDGRHCLVQPAHFQAEVCGVLARQHGASVREDLRDLLELRIPTRDDELVMWRAMQLSAQLDHHLFDTLYHALALETDGAVLVTADETYFRKAAALGRLMPLSAWTVH